MVYFIYAIKIGKLERTIHFILDLNAIPMLKYRSLKKIDWAGPAGAARKRKRIAG